MPQMVEAEWDGWPEDYTGRGVEATGWFVDRHRRLAEAANIARPVQGPSFVCVSRQSPRRRVSRASTARDAQLPRIFAF